MRVQPSLPPHSTPIRPSNNFPFDHKYERHLEQGSEGDIDLWSHQETGQFLVVKTLKKDVLQRVKGIPNEVHILKALPYQKHVIRCEAFYEKIGPNGKDCILFEYCQNADLYSLRGNRWDNGSEAMFSEKFMWAVYSQLSAALAFLHEGIEAPRGTKTDFWKPIVHRDIKLENVFIKTLGTKPDMSSIIIKLADFGLATFYDPAEAEMHRWHGTPEYWPPEILYNDRTYGLEADIWAAGAVIHELAHGFPPTLYPDDWARHVQEKRRELLPKDWSGMGPESRKFWWAIVTPRRALPVNLDPEQQQRDPRRLKHCPKYSDTLNASLMMALTMDRDLRLRAGELKNEVDDGYAGFLHKELMEETENLMLEEREQKLGSESESE